MKKIILMLCVLIAMPIYAQNRIAEIVYAYVEIDFQKVILAVEKITEGTNAPSYKVRFAAEGSQEAYDKATSNIRVSEGDDTMKYKQQYNLYLESGTIKIDDVTLIYTEDNKDEYFATVKYTNHKTYKWNDEDKKEQWLEIPESTGEIDFSVKKYGKNK